MPPQKESSRDTSSGEKQPTLPNMNLPLRTQRQGPQKASIPPSPQSLASKSSLIFDPLFNLLYANNKANLKHFLEQHAPLSRDKLNPLYQYVQGKEEPGAKVQYENIRPTLSILRPFLLKAANDGVNLLNYFRDVVKIHGYYVVTTAETLSFEVFARMTEALFISGNDTQLRNHILNVLPEYGHVLKQYPPGACTLFKTFISDKRKQVREKNAEAIRALLDLKESKMFAAMHKKLIMVIELHEKKLAEVRVRKQSHATGRRFNLAVNRARNRVNMNRQMGTAGLTSHSANIEASVVDYVRENHKEHFPILDEEEDFEVPNGENPDGEDLFLQSNDMS